MNAPGWHSIPVALLLAACKPAEPPAPPPPPEVTVAQVVTRDVPVYLEAVGETAGSLDIAIRARVDGVIEKLHFMEGKKVRKGQLLYTIDPAPFEAKVREAEGKLAEANAQFVRAESNLNRVRPLVEIDALSKRTLDDAQAEYDASVGLVKANQALVEYAKIELGYSEIKSPIDGLIGASEAYASDYVGRFPNPIVLNTVSKLHPIRVRFSISEQDYLMLVRKHGLVKERKEKRLELFLADGSLYPHEGTFVFAGREIDAKTGTLLIEATFPNPKIPNPKQDEEDGHVLRPGQFARVRATIDIKKDAPLVPQRAVRELQGTYQLFVVGAENKVEQRNVTVGVRVGELWLIEEGVKAGERVVVSGLHRVRSGMTVKPVAQEQKGKPEGSAR